MAGVAGAAAGAAVPDGEAAASAVVLAEPFLPLTALDRILQPSPQRDRTFVFALLIVALLHLGALAGAVELSDAAMLQLPNKGQVDTENVVTVELVSAPDREAKKVDIARAETGDPNNLPPVRTEPMPEQAPQKPQEKVQPLEPAEKVEKAEKAEQKAGKDEAPLQPVAPDEGPGPMASLDPKTAPDLKEAAEAKEAKELKEEREAREAVQPNKVLQLRSAAPKGQKVYEGLVYKALFKTEPQIWFNRAEVMVAFVVSPTGVPEQITIVRSSNDKIFDDVVFEWIKRARLPPPPPNATVEDRIFHFRYVIQ